jgi:hydroxypyruvate isomerase
MDRRLFVKKSATLASFLGLGLSRASAFNSPYKLDKNNNIFPLRFAPHINMFENHAGKDPIDQLNFMADEGFTAFEDNNMIKRPVKTQEAMAETMIKRNMSMGVFVAHKVSWKDPNLASGDLIKREAFLEEIKEALVVAKRVNAKWMTVVPGHVDLKQKMDYQTEHVIETLKQASAILEPHNIVMVLEPLNFKLHPGQFLTESPQAYQICKAVNSPSCKILFDIYHQQIQEGNLIPNIEQCWDEIAYFQAGDNPGRTEPTTGEINFKNVFKYIHSKGYTGIIGMEHKNSKEGKIGERTVIDAYKTVSDF